MHSESEKRAFAGIDFVNQLRRLAHHYGWHYSIRYFFYQDMFAVRILNPYSAALFQSIVASKLTPVLHRLGVTAQEAADAMSELNKHYDKHLAFIRLPRPKVKG